MRSMQGAAELDYDRLLAPAAEPFQYLWQGSSNETHPATPLRSWEHLAVLLSHLGDPGLNFLIVSRCTGHRAAQVLGTPKALVLELLPPARVLRVGGSHRPARFISNGAGIGDNALAGEHLTAMEARAILKAYMETGLLPAPWTAREYRY
jgi:hypothetical protein